MRYASRKVRYEDGTEDTACVGLHVPFGGKAEAFDGRLVTVIDERAPGAERPRKAKGIDFPAIGGRTFMGGYRSKAWGIVDTSPEGIREAKERTPEWDYDPATGDAIIPSESAMRRGIDRIRCHEALDMARQEEAEKAEAAAEHEGASHE